MVLLGNRVLIKLDDHPTHTVTPGNITVPHFVNMETDGGRVKASVSDLKYLSQGTIVDISAEAVESTAKYGVTLGKGDRVLVSSNAVSPSYQFIQDRSRIIAQFDGHILIPPQLIEAKL